MANDLVSSMKRPFSKAYEYLRSLRDQSRLPGIMNIPRDDPLPSLSSFVHAAEQEIFCELQNQLHQIEADGTNDVDECIALCEQFSTTESNALDARCDTLGGCTPPYPPEVTTSQP
jgi:hypothetical protein